MAALRTLDRVDLAGKRVLVRVDLNVPMQRGQVSDLTRIEQIVPTLREITEKGGRVILISHCGRPSGRDEAFSLRNVAAAVESASGRSVVFCDDCVGEAVKRAASNLTEGAILLLENVRFYPEEEANEPQFARALAANADVFVNDAFSASHRAHASIEGLARILPAYAGRAMQAEIRALDTVLDSPEKPVAALVGGAKISSKLPILERLIKLVDTLIIGGAMASTFLLARGTSVGRTLTEPDLVETARALLSLAETHCCNVLLPVDAICARQLSPNTSVVTVATSQIPPDLMMLDVGPKSREAICKIVETSRTLLWNGPLGAFETQPFEQGTFDVARLAAQSTEQGRLRTVAGGGDTVAALNAAGVTDRFTHVSTAGGAFLEWLQAGMLPGVVPLFR